MDEKRYHVQSPLEVTLFLEFILFFPLGLGKALLPTLPTLSLYTYGKTLVNVDPSAPSANRLAELRLGRSYSPHKLNYSTFPPFFFVTDNKIPSICVIQRGVRESGDGVTGGGTVRISLHRPPQRAVRHAANGLLLNTDSTLLLHKAPQYIVRYQKLPENICSKLKQVSFSGDFSQKKLV